MVEDIIKENLKNINTDLINTYKKIDCVTIFPLNANQEDFLNKEMLNKGKVIDKMESGILYVLNKSIFTEYGDLKYLKIRKYDSNYISYGISIDFTIDNYNEYKKELENPTIKKYDTFELIQFKSDKSIINIVSVGIDEDYNLK